MTVETTTAREATRAESKKSVFSLLTTPTIRTPDACRTCGATEYPCPDHEVPEYAVYARRRREVEGRMAGGAR